MITKVNLLSLLILGIPEAIAETVVAFAFARILLPWKRIFIVGITLALTVFLVRLLPLHFGFHTLFTLVALAVYVRIATGSPLSNTIKSATIALMLLVVSEFAVEVIGSYLFPTLFSSKQPENISWLLLGWPSILFVFAVGLYTDSRNRKSMNKTYVRIPGEKIIPSDRR